MNISSIVVQTKPEFYEELINTINESDVCEYHLKDDKGKIIVTIEGENTEEEVAKLKVLQSFPRVISAEMMFSYSEDELDGIRDNLEATNDNVPSWLNDESVGAEDIKYNGDLKKRF